MEATVNMPAQPRNWGMVIRVGIVLAVILSLLGYALKVTYESVIQGGVVKENDYYRVELKAMGNFEMDQVNGTLDDVPPIFRKLDGEKVMLIGEVAPGGLESGPKVHQFDICYSVAKCCFGGPPKKQHFVRCRAPQGKTVPNYLGGPGIKVFGTLHVEIVKEAGEIASIYQLDIERVEPIP